MNILKTLQTNWRDILIATVIIIAVAFVADVIERLSVTEDGMVWLASVVHAFKGLSNFAAANLACWFMLAVSWPSINRWSHAGFKRAWNSMPDEGKLLEVFSLR